MSEGVVTVVGLAPYKLVAVEREEGTFHLDPVPTGERYSRLVVRDGKTNMDMGIGTMKMAHVTPARGLAEDLIRGSEEHGLFIIDGDSIPSEAQLASEEAKLRERYVSWVDEGESIYARTHDARQVPHYARVAAKAIGAQRDWASRLDMQVPCKACQELITPNIPRCPKCQAILDWELALQFGLLDERQEAFARDKGFIAPARSASPVTKK